jgi:hypothetical protein
MDNFWRIILVLAIWVAFGTIAAAAVLAPSRDSNTTDIVTTAMFMVTISTAIIWLGPEIVSRRRSKSETHFISGEAEKAKRGAGNGSNDPRLALLLDLMDEDERQTLKERLRRQVLDEAYLTDDGEIAYRGESLANLLEEEAAKQQLRH